MAKEKRIALYSRVSSKAQDTASQEPDLQRWREAHADGMVVEHYRDKFTGKTMNRPGWDKLSGAIARGEIGSVVVWRLDRLGGGRARAACGTRKPFPIHLRLGCVDTRHRVKIFTSEMRYETERDYHSTGNGSCCWAD
jgi:hypothetical protein